MCADERPPMAWNIASSEWEEGGGHGQERLRAFLEEAAEVESVRRAAARAFDLLRLQSGERVLDVGCGTGVLLPVLAEAVAPTGSVVGIDSSGAFLETARARVDRAGVGTLVTVREADAHRLPFPDDSFDAARVERVLMHVDEPDIVLGEMRRVVKPGGRVVAIEPDWAGIRYDHPDEEAIRLLHLRMTAKIRHRGMGFELNRRMAQAGLVDRTIAPVTEFLTEYEPEVAAGHAQVADALVAEGLLTRERADAALDHLRTANREGRFSCYGSLFVVCGCVPAP